MKSFLWKCLGFLSLGMAYLGIITPGLPYSIFVVFAAYCFGKSSPKMHAWIYNHKLFGPFLTNWTTKRIFPTKMKYLMIAVMSSSLIMMWLTTYNARAILFTGLFMMAVAVWAWRFPDSVEEYQRRKDNKERIGWLK
jgi:uncharacterized membrane protein YbaN (DUF454 family)